MAEKSKILIIGATGYLGKYIVRASAKANYPTFALVRESTVSSPKKSQLLHSFTNNGVTLLSGDVNDYTSLVNAIKQVDVVISAIGTDQIADQLKIVSAIKEAGNVKRFLPSEFGTDPDYVRAVEPAASFFGLKARIRRAVEAAGIPYTYIVSYGFAGFFLPKLGQPNAKAPPRDNVAILGDGNPKAIFVKEEDIATYTIKAVDDPRTLNKSLYLRPPANILSFNEIVSLWEKKIGNSLEKTHILDDQILQQIKELQHPFNLYLSLSHSTFVYGGHASFNALTGVEASQLYPEVKYTSVDEFLDHFV